MKITTLLLLLLSTSACLAGVEVNKATEAELDGIKGLGPASTARILKERSQGEFTGWTNFMARVKGIRSITATKLSNEGLMVNGKPFDSNPAH